MARWIHVPCIQLSMAYGLVPRPVFNPVVSPQARQVWERDHNMAQYLGQT